MLPVVWFRVGKFFMWDLLVNLQCKITEEVKRAGDRALADVDIITRVGENGMRLCKTDKISLLSGLDWHTECHREL